MSSLGKIVDFSGRIEGISLLRRGLDRASLASVSAQPKEAGLTADVGFSDDGLVAGAEATLVVIGLTFHHDRAGVAVDPDPVLDGVGARIEELESEAVPEERAQSQRGERLVGREDLAIDLTLGISVHREQVVVSATRSGRGSGEVIQPVQVIDEAAVDGSHLRYGFTLDTQRAERDLEFRPADRIGLARAGDGALQLETTSV